MKHNHTFKVVSCLSCLPPAIGRDELWKANYQETCTWMLGHTLMSEISNVSVKLKIMGGDGRTDGWMDKWMGKGR